MKVDTQLIMYKQVHDRHLKISTRGTFINKYIILRINKYMLDIYKTSRSKICKKTIRIKLSTMHIVACFKYIW